MNDNVADITPPHDPIALARDMEKEAQGEKCVAGFYMLVRGEGSLVYEGCADRTADLLWALERLKAKVLA